MTRVELGQVWSMSANATQSGQVRWRVEAFVGVTVPRALVELVCLATGRRKTTTTRTLERGARGARLEVHADGTPNVPVVRWGGGVNKRVATKRAFEAVARMAAGHSKQSVAEYYRVSASTVGNWALSVKKANEGSVGS